MRVGVGDLARGRGGTFVAQVGVLARRVVRRLALLRPLAPLPRLQSERRPVGRIERDGEHNRQHTVPESDARVEGNEVLPPKASQQEARRDLRQPRARDASEEDRPCAACCQHQALQNHRKIHEYCGDGEGQLHVLEAIDDVLVSREDVRERLGQKEDHNAEHKEHADAHGEPNRDHSLGGFRFGGAQFEGELQRDCRRHRTCDGERHPHHSVRGVEDGQVGCVEGGCNEANHRESPEVGGNRESRRHVQLQISGHACPADVLEGPAEKAAVWPRRLVHLQHSAVHDEHEQQLRVLYRGGDDRASCKAIGGPAFDRPAQDQLQPEHQVDEQTCDGCDSEGPYDLLRGEVAAELVETDARGYACHQHERVVRGVLNEPTFCLEDGEYGASQRPQTHHKDADWNQHEHRELQPLPRLLGLASTDSIAGKNTEHSPLNEDSGCLCPKV
mmetsp:Transcript_10911/g.25311  ORF Transcript_10911/g.25311 Transcript_10911/m.25311 type:complete len:445 (-) Transcript_10911:193-1527(-)